VYINETSQHNALGREANEFIVSKGFVQCLYQDIACLYLSYTLYILHLMLSANTPVARQADHKHFPLPFLQICMVLLMAACIHLSHVKHYNSEYCSATPVSVSVRGEQGKTLRLCKSSYILLVCEVIHFLQTCWWKTSVLH
jgi:hypothetical protein